MGTVYVHCSAIQTHPLTQQGQRFPGMFVGSWSFAACTAVIPLILDGRSVPITLGVGISRIHKPLGANLRPQPRSCPFRPPSFPIACTTEDHCHASTVSGCTTKTPPSFECSQRLTVDRNSLLPKPFTLLMLYFTPHGECTNVMLLNVMLLVLWCAIGLFCIV
jgi:hypothetical protein